jgi:hypothetical protein
MKSISRKNPNGNADFGLEKFMNEAVDGGDASVEWSRLDTGSWNPSEASIG